MKRSNRRALNLFTLEKNNDHHKSPPSDGWTLLTDQILRPATRTRKAMLNKKRRHALAELSLAGEKWELCILGNNIIDEQVTCTYHALMFVSRWAHNIHNFF